MAAEYRESMRMARTYVETQAESGIYYARSLPKGGYITNVPRPEIAQVYALLAIAAAIIDLSGELHSVAEELKSISFGIRE